MGLRDLISDMCACCGEYCQVGSSRLSTRRSFYNGSDRPIDVRSLPATVANLFERGSKCRLMMESKIKPTIRQSRWCQAGVCNPRKQREAWAKCCLKIPSSHEIRGDFLLKVAATYLTQFCIPTIGVTVIDLFSWWEGRQSCTPDLTCLLQATPQPAAWLPSVSSHGAI